jgi:hypothetical protein
VSDVYCIHPFAQPWGYGGYCVCGICGSEWYGTDPAPLVVIGATSAAEVPRYKHLAEIIERQRKDGGGQVE